MSLKKGTVTRKATNMAKKRHYDPIKAAKRDYNYEHVSERSLMKNDGGLISRDASAPAGMPQGIISKKFPEALYALRSDYEAGIGAIDKQRGMDSSALRAINKNPRKI